jgi:hypothetical protein
MILIAGFVVIVASVALRGSRLTALADLRVRWCPAVAAALALQVLIISVFPDALPPSLAAALHVVSYVLGVAFLFANRRVPGLWLIGVGALCNLAAIGANGGVMPASASALATAGITSPNGQHFANSAARHSPRLAFLGDIFAIPSGLPFANVFSIGDIVLLAGATVLLHRACARGSAAEQLRG